MRISPMVMCYSVPKTVAKPAATTTFAAKERRPREIKSYVSNGQVYYYIPKGSEKLYSSKNRNEIELPGDFRLVDYDKIPCPACGVKLMPEDKFYEFKEKLDETTPNEYLNVVDSYKEYLRPIESSVLKDLQELSERTGEKDIRKLLVKLRNIKLPLLQEVQMDMANKMIRLAKTLPRAERDILLEKVSKLKSIIKQEKPSSPFRRKILIDKISRVPITNVVKYEKLQQIARNFPTSSDLNSAWIIKYSGTDKNNKDWNSYDIALRMFSTSVPNTDHILARDIERHHDEISNYLAMHSACNCTKSNKTFLEWYGEDKNLRQKSLEAYFDSADKLIKSGEIDDPRYKDYVEKATQVIYNISNGKVDLRKKKVPKQQ